MIYFIIWLVINIVTAYDFMNLTCPHPGQWKLRARAKNCSSIQNYVCLFDAVQLTFEENCIGPRDERIGNKLVLNIGNFNRKPCSSTHYQPLTFFSFGNTNCSHLKSPCSEEGQVIADNGTSYSDRSCRCDYRQGYAFVNDTSVHCSCMPSKEECTCFQKSCRENEVLSPDYKCVKEIEQPGNYTCSQLLDKNSIESGTADVNPMYDFSNRYYDTDTDYFVEPLEEIVNCLKGETVTLSCKVNKERTTGIWFKDSEKLNGESPDIRLIAEGKFHKLEIVNVRIEHRGYYTLYIKKIASSSLLLVIGKNFRVIDRHDKYEKKPGQRGLALIVNFMFHGETSERKGSDVDCKNLTIFFKEELKYQVECTTRDMTKLQLMKYFQEIARTYLTEKSKDYHSFICVIMSHGNEDGILTTNGLITVEEIKKPFKNKSGGKFNGKPKLFLIQACRGTEEQEKVVVSDCFGTKIHTGHVGRYEEFPGNRQRRSSVETSVIRPGILDQPSASSEVFYTDAHSNSSKNVPTDADIIVAYASTPGAFFIRAFLSVAKSKYNEEHIEEILRYVRNEIATNPEYAPQSGSLAGKCQMAQVETTSTKKFFL
ncbi:Hypothetical predicted protein [Mytilus galloprovincialis]|uniref:Uncharacterized protein n=1 Tax=Mytilus galloprovincialis TaxID=29158 RepID=A0A8B6HKG9_MYTGA|nr:Hypothetical predicted protein [Mytilus galloprovincialis]